MAQPETMLTHLGPALNVLRIEIMRMRTEGGASGDYRTRYVCYQAEHIIDILDNGEGHASWLGENQRKDNPA